MMRRVVAQGAQCELRLQPPCANALRGRFFFSAPRNPGCSLSLAQSKRLFSTSRCLFNATAAGGNFSRSARPVSKGVSSTSHSKRDLSPEEDQSLNDLMSELEGDGAATSKHNSQPTAATGAAEARATMQRSRTQPAATKIVSVLSARNAAGAARNKVREPDVIFPEADAMYNGEDEPTHSYQSTNTAGNDEEEGYAYEAEPVFAMDEFVSKKEEARGAMSKPRHDFTDFAEPIVKKSISKKSDRMRHKASSAQPIQPPPPPPPPAQHQHQHQQPVARKQEVEAPVAADADDELLSEIPTPSMQRNPEKIMERYHDLFLREVEPKRFTSSFAMRSRIAAPPRRQPVPVQKEDDLDVEPVDELYEIRNGELVNANTSRGGAPSTPQSFSATPSAKASEEHKDGEKHVTATPPVHTEPEVAAEEEVSASTHARKEHSSSPTPATKAKTFTSSFHKKREMASKWVPPPPQPAFDEEEHGVPEVHPVRANRANAVADAHADESRGTHAKSNMEENGNDVEEAIPEEPKSVRGGISAAATEKGKLEDSNNDHEGDGNDDGDNGSGNGEDAFARVKQHPFYAELVRRTALKMQRHTKQRSFSRTSKYSQEVINDCVRPLLQLADYPFTIEQLCQLAPSLYPANLKRSLPDISACRRLNLYRSSDTGVVLDWSVEDFLRRRYESIHVSWEPMSVVYRRFGWSPQVMSDRDCLLFFSEFGGFVELARLERSSAPGSDPRAIPILNPASEAEQQPVPVSQLLIRRKSQESTEPSITESIRLTGAPALAPHKSGARGAEEHVVHSMFSKIADEAADVDGSEEAKLTHAMHVVPSLKQAARPRGNNINEFSLGRTDVFPPHDAEKPTPLRQQHQHNEASSSTPAAHGNGDKPVSDSFDAGPMNYSPETLESLSSAFHKAKVEVSLIRRRLIATDNADAAAELHDKLGEARKNVQVIGQRLEKMKELQSGGTGPPGRSSHTSQHSASETQLPKNWVAAEDSLQGIEADDTDMEVEHHIRSSKVLSTRDGAQGDRSSQGALLSAAADQLRLEIERLHEQRLKEEELLQQRIREAQNTLLQLNEKMLDMRHVDHNRAIAAAEAEAAAAAEAAQREEQEAREKREAEERHRLIEEEAAAAAAAEAEAQRLWEEAEQRALEAVERLRVQRVAAHKEAERRREEAHTAALEAQRVLEQQKEIERAAVEAENALQMRLDEAEAALRAVHTRTDEPVESSLPSRNPIHSAEYDENITSDDSVLETHADPVSKSPPPPPPPPPTPSHPLPPSPMKAKTPETPAPDSRSTTPNSTFSCTPDQYDGMRIAAKRLRREIVMLEHQMETEGHEDDPTLMTVLVASRVDLEELDDYIAQVQRTCAWANDRDREAEKRASADGDMNQCDPREADILVKIETIRFSIRLLKKRIQATTQQSIVTKLEQKVIQNRREVSRLRIELDRLRRATGRNGATGTVVEDFPLLENLDPDDDASMRGAIIGSEVDVEAKYFSGRHDKDAAHDEEGASDNAQTNDEEGAESYGADGVEAEADDADDDVPANGDDEFVASDDVGDMEEQDVDEMNSDDLDTNDAANDETVGDESYDETDELNGDGEGELDGNGEDDGLPSDNAGEDDGDEDDASTASRTGGEEEGLPWMKNAANAKAANDTFTQDHKEILINMDTCHGGLQRQQKLREKLAEVDRDIKHLQRNLNGQRAVVGGSSTTTTTTGLDDSHDTTAQEMNRKLAQLRVLQASLLNRVRQSNGVREQAQLGGADEDDEKAKPERPAQTTNGSRPPAARIEKVGGGRRVITHAHNNKKKVNGHKLQFTTSTEHKSTPAAEGISAATSISSKNRLPPPGEQRSHTSTPNNRGTDRMTSSTLPAANDSSQHRGRRRQPPVQIRSSLKASDARKTNRTADAGSASNSNSNSSTGAASRGPQKGSSAANNKANPSSHGRARKAPKLPTGGTGRKSGSSAAAATAAASKKNAASSSSSAGRKGRNAKVTAKSATAAGSASSAKNKSKPAARRATGGSASKQAKPKKPATRAGGAKSKSKASKPKGKKK